MKTINIEGMIIKDSAKATYDNAKIKTTSVSDVTSQLTGKEDIKIICNSIGGDVFAGSEIYTALKKYQGKIDAEVIFAASIATVIVMAADKISMTPTGQFMIHNVSTSVEGDYRDMEKSAQTLRNMNAMIASSYKSRMKVSDEQLAKMMDDETWLNAEQAKSIGLIDEIMFENKSKSYVACFSNNMSFEGGEKVEEEKEVKSVSKEDFEAFKKEMLDILADKFKNETDETDEQRLVRRIDQLEKLKEDGNALSDAERVELIDDLLQLVRDNRQQAQPNDNDSDDANNKEEEEEFQNKKTKLGLFL